ncbi:hypothetical protein KP13_02468 [Klebsiella pneumoniae subsp. pneumoniae Kp13]|nr:hypothetical protein KP13_02468 [Klebsiella pneumoniae subsp. pneumoniae Kp13]
MQLFRIGLEVAFFDRHRIGRNGKTEQENCKKSVSGRGAAAKATNAALSVRIRRGN